MSTMPSRDPTLPRPEVGDTLMVIHIFQARSSDELSLAKGDKVELVERDDEFGDGWFLGRHLVNGNTGLFPEVYTRPIPKSTLTSSFTPSQPLLPLAENGPPPPNFNAKGNLHPPVNDSSPLPKHLAPLEPKDPSLTLPLNSVKSDAATMASLKGPPQSAALGRLNNTSQDSQVLNDTLNVINEHITDLRSAPSSNALRTTTATDSSSDYSAPLDRMSYIQGDETDEEEEDTHSRAEVEGWTADQVAEYLFTSGVEKHHCEVFRDQEISGEVVLGMDQSSLFINAFDLGSVGRRLKTWHKIKALQDETSGFGPSSRPSTQLYGSEAGSEGLGYHRSRTNTLTTNSTGIRPPSIQTGRLSLNQTPKAPAAPFEAAASPNNLQESSYQLGHTKRPSAASIRDLNHSRRHSSSTDFRISGPISGAVTPKLTPKGTYPGASTTHKKQPSFDRNWSIGNAFSQGGGFGFSQSRPLSATAEPDLQDSAVDLDRGYFSGTEADTKKRNFLRKKESLSSRKSRNSYAEEQRVRSATALTRHSRFGSVDSVRETPSGAAVQYYGASAGPHRRTASAATQDSYRPPPPAKDGPPPTVTKIESDTAAPVTSPTSVKSPGWFASVVHKPMGKAGGSMRAISDNLGLDRQKMKQSTEPTPNDQALQSPARAESTTPSGEQSLDTESPDAAKSPSAFAAPANKARGRKGKKETSAYLKGLQKISPKEAMEGAEYSGWMRKKSSNLMTTWKPRFFVLKGRRLAYYYSENDEEEKGLIDISFHRVLPADNERLTGLHATITGVVDRPGHASAELQKGDDSMFIFKLVPPRAGLARAVNFTKPTIHYFAVPNLSQGRLWMAALMKATIDRDETQPMTTTYQQKTISLSKAKQMRHRPPALMNLEETAEDDTSTLGGKKDTNGLGIYGETDSGVSGMEKRANQSTDAPNLENSVEENPSNKLDQTA